MYRCGIIPYEGTEPYIFISYSHQDCDKVFPILEELGRRGYRIWYDDGIAPGSEWPENIAQHLNSCSLTMAFISPNALASANCRREINFALSKQKPFLAVHLEPTEMSLGMEMQLSAQQCVMKYSYTSEEKFLEKVCSCPDLAPCRTTPSVPEGPGIPEDPPVIAEPAAEVPLRPQPKAPKKAKTKPAPSRKKHAMGLIVGIAACVIAFCILLNVLSQVRITPELKVGRSETFLSIRDETITQETITSINKLRKLETLIFQDCVFEDNAFGAWETHEALITFSITDCAGVDHLDFLNRQPDLASLTLQNCGLTNEILPSLEYAGMSRLILADNPELTDMSKLSSCTNLYSLDISGTGVDSLHGLPIGDIYSLDFSDTAVSDISPLAEMTTLDTVKGARTPVQDISPLADMTDLASLDFSDCRISKIPDTFQSLRLRELYLGGNGLSSADAFSNCTILTHVDLSNNSISDLSWLAKSSQTLTFLDISRNPLPSSVLTFLASCGKLTELHLDGISTGDLAFLEGFTELVSFSAGSCGLTDITGLSGCTKLKQVSLANNSITDISPLSGITTEFLLLDLGYNPLEDVSALPKVYYSTLSLVSDTVDLTTLPEVKGTTLLLQYSIVIPFSPLQNDPFLNYYMIACPADQQVAMEDLYGASRVTFVSEDSIAEQMAEFFLDYSFMN